MTPMSSLAAPLPTSRQDLMARLAQPLRYDLAVVGGGATGLGVALDAATRGLKVVLVESHDFAGGTSSRATKLVHGGVRYLAQGNISLVREALHERTNLLANAPHLAQPLPFVMPCYKYWEAPFYGAGLKMYDALAGRAGLGPTEFLSRDKTLGLLPMARAQGLKGGVRYWDGQFDDARLALALARTAASKGALLVNYCAAVGLVHDAGKVVGLVCRDQETGQSLQLSARCVVNATGVWVDTLREQDATALGRPNRAMVAPSQGVHVVVDRDFLDSDHALLVPKTADGRVLFAVPWLGKVILGTTDTPRDDLAREPRPFAHELEFILGEAARYLKRAPGQQDIRSVWVGLRPLVKPQGDDGEATQKISREHTVRVSKSGLVTVTGGKWTTYRAMAQDVLDHCVDKRLLPALPSPVTAHTRLIGSPEADSPIEPNERLSEAPGQHTYGLERIFLADVPGATTTLSTGLTEGMVRFAARYEYARTVEDILARRSRLLFLDAAAAGALAPQVACVLQQETGRDPQIPAFEALARTYAQQPVAKT
jgi:glycerol-3-phosphate dehydrogenase